MHFLGDCTQILFMISLPSLGTSFFRGWNFSKGKYCPNFFGENNVSVFSPDYYIRASHIRNSYIAPFFLHHSTQIEYRAAQPVIGFVPLNLICFLSPSRRVPGLPNSNFLESCNNLMTKMVNLNTAGVTQIFFLIVCIGFRTGPIWALCQTVRFLHTPNVH